MRTHVQFVSEAFPPYAGEQDDINPGIWGKRLAEFLASQLPKHGVTTGQFHREDWGWEIPIGNHAFPMFVGCSNQLEPNGNVFLCFINPSRPRIRKGPFRTVDATKDIERVADALNAILEGNPEIRELRWWDENER